MTHIALQCKKEEHQNCFATICDCNCHRHPVTGKESPNEQRLFNQFKNLKLRKDEIVDKGIVRRLRYCEQCRGLTVYKDNKCSRCYRI